MAVERQPLTRLQDQQKSFQSKLSAFGQLKSAMSKLQDAAATLAKSHHFLGHHRQRGRYQGVHRQLDHLGADRQLQHRSPATRARAARGDQRHHCAHGRRGHADHRPWPLHRRWFRRRRPVARRSRSTSPADRSRPRSASTTQKARSAPDEGSAKTITPSGEPELSDLRNAINNANVGESAQVSKRHR